MKLSVKSPYLCLFWALPFIAALAHDVFVWRNVGVGFHLSEIGYLIQHYTKWHDPIVALIDHPWWRKFLKFLFTARAAVFAGVLAALAVAFLNRRRYGETRSSVRRFRR